MSFSITLDDAQRLLPKFRFVRALTPSAHKSAFHVKDADGRDRCLKVFSPDFPRDRADREVEALQTLKHPGIVEIIEYTFSTTGGETRHYVVEDFIAGDDLEAHFKPGVAWPVQRTVGLFAALCDALEVLRTKEIVHRDLKPANVRVRPNGYPVIIDFGLARHLAKPDLTATAAGAAIGTPIYFAPEQFVGNKHDIDHRTDLFALGIMLHQALAGAHPFWNTTMSLDSLQNAVCSGHFDVHAVPERLRMLTSRLLSPDRVDRPASAAQVATHLRKIEGT